MRKNQQDSFNHFQLHKCRRDSERQACREFLPSSSSSTRRGERTASALLVGLLCWCVSPLYHLNGVSMTDNQGNANIRPPQFTAANGPGLSAPTSAAVQNRGTPSTLNLDDIFGDCFFTPEGDAIFLSENPQLQREVQQQQQLTQQQQQLAAAAAQAQAQAQGLVPSGESTPSQNASRPVGAGYQPVPQGGGITTTGLHRPNTNATVMGKPIAATAPAQVPLAQPPQRAHHLPYATVGPAYVQAGGQTAAPTVPATMATPASATATSNAGKKRAIGTSAATATKPPVEKKSMDRRYARVNSTVQTVSYSPLTLQRFASKNIQSSC